MEIMPLDILLAEDNEDDIVMIREALESAHLVNLMHVVGDGDEVLRYLRREGQFGGAPRPGLVLLDINMPGKNGFEALDEIKNDPALAAMPVVMLTTSEREEDIVRSYSGGACSFITKPFAFEDFVKVAQKFSIYWAMVARVPSKESKG